MWTTTLVAGAAGAILTLGVLGAVGALGTTSDHPATEHEVVPTERADRQRADGRDRRRAVRSSR